ncbi:MAG: MetQ/NlpA family ABC transporter substrate-binding protein [Archaeoglobaceae archaeon]
MKRLLPLVALILLSGCSQHGEELKVGILPIEDSLPIVVADEEGIFEAHGLSVEVVHFSSAVERDAALMAGEVDAVITDPLAVLLLRDKGYDVKIASICLGVTPKEGVFAILASPGSQIESVEDLEGKEIAVSLNTIIDYALDVMLSEYGIKNYTKVSIPKIPLRLQALLSGEVEVAVLPEPLASYAVSKGAKLILSDAMLNESVTQTVIVFRSDVDSETVRKFLEAYGEAVDWINADKEKYREKFVEIARIPEEIAEVYPIPDYPKPQKFPREFYDRYVQWALERGLISRQIPYEEVVE